MKTFTQMLDSVLKQIDFKPATTVVDRANVNLETLCNVLEHTHDSLMEAKKDGL